MRVTRQRQLIIDTIRQTKSHPTALEVYDEVRKYMPNISLGTVYRNLDILSKQGNIAKIATCGEQKRFDGNTEDHLHVICTVCGRIKDVDDELDINIDKLANIDTEFAVTGVRVEILGLCPDCRINNV